MPKKEKQKSISELKAERSKLLISREDPKRLEEITKEIDYLEWGIK